MSRPVSTIQYILRAIRHEWRMSGVVRRISKAWKEVQGIGSSTEAGNAGKGERATILCEEYCPSAPYYARKSPGEGRVRGLRLYSQDYYTLAKTTKTAKTW